MTDQDARASFPRPRSSSGEISGMQVNVAHFDPMSDTDTRNILDLYTAYLTEELERTGEFSPGYPLSINLGTVLIHCDHEPTGFMSVDAKRRSIEMIYIAPGHRGKGLATKLVGDLARTCPQPLALKAPLSPDGEALARRLGLGVTHHTAEDQADDDQTMADAHRSMQARCKHKRTGNPSRVCKRCYRAGLKRYAATLVTGYVLAYRTMYGTIRIGTS